MIQPWQAATLKAARAAVGLTQEELAKRAGIDRSRYNALENGRERLTIYYAELLAPHLNRNVHELLPPGSLSQDPEDPLLLLRALGETVDRMQAALDAHEVRLAALEQEPRTGQRGLGDER